MKRNRTIKAIFIIAVLAVCAWVCTELEQAWGNDDRASVRAATLAGEPYVEINDNQPEFEENELTTEAFEEYSELDSLGRCGTAEACVGEETMPTEERGDISSVKPTGWKNKDYDNVDGDRIPADR